MNRLIVISNRVQTPASGAAQGGLAVALQSALKARKGIWFGWSGETVDRYTGHLRMAEHGGVRTATVDLEEQDVDEYYNGYANRTLWPLFHFRIDIAEYTRSFGEGYERVNRRLAETVIPLVEPGDLVWVHDYHLIPLGWDMRRRGMKNRIGFFLHTPWPPTRLLVSLPHHERLVQSLFAYDVVGFQTAEWLESFRHYCEKEMGATIDGDTIRVGSSTLTAVACPIGIDYDEFADASRSSPAQSALRTMRASLQDRKLIVGVDRLDYSKGLPERFEGFDHFLKTHEDWHRDVVMVQIAPPSRADVKSYRDIRAELDSMSGRINGAYAHVDWTPIRYVNKGYPREELAGIYRAADVALVTPLRDGMNLVAKEYVVAQDHDDPGVLILSRFAGAAHQLGVQPRERVGERGALLVNPYAREEVSDAIRQAISMDIAERRERHAYMDRNIREEDVTWWRDRFVGLLAGEKTVAA